MNIITPNNILLFPKKTAEGDVYLHELDDYNRNIVDKHLKFAGEIIQWLNINEWLCSQIHDNKCIQKSFKKINYPPDPLTRYYYENYINFGKKYISPIDTFPAQFKNLLEVVMLKELSNKNFNYLAIYYNHHDKPPELMYSEFNKNDWKLSEGYQMSEQDIGIMEKYKSGFTKFLNRCIDLINQHKLDHNKTCLREINRIKKIMNKNLPSS